MLYAGFGSDPHAGSAPVHGLWDITDRIGDASYAMVELIAELGAAFLCAELAIAPEPGTDHAAYIKSWVSIMTSEKKAIFSAAAKVSHAAVWLMGQEEGAG